MREPLTESELEVLRLVVAGHTNQEIAEIRVVTLSTVKTHINNLYSKLQVRNRAEAIRRAREWQLPVFEDTDLPAPPVDPLPPIRRLMSWWGVLAGGASAVLLAVVIVGGLLFRAARSLPPQDGLSLATPAAPLALQPGKTEGPSPPGAPDPTVTVIHWSNGHLMRTGSGLRLLEQMADEFNQAGHKTQSGKPIEVKVLYYGSWEQAQDLLSRVTRDVPLDRERPDPTIVTPSAAHWLLPVNQAAGRTVVDPGAAPSIARALIGIVTYRDMAECLGWPDKALGYADIIALRNDPQGWARYPCAKAEWGQRPLVAFTDPTTSSTGRSVLFTLYAIAAGKAPEQLTVADVTRPEIVAYVKRFQSLIDHYMISTRIVNTKVHQGPRYGHFFLMPEDNLVHLYQGTEKVFINGVKKQAPPIERPMVMLYPKEGSMARNNCACIVQAPWVTPEHAEAARQWVDYLREDNQQQDLMRAGFRPGTQLRPAAPISGRFGLDPREPPVVFSAARIAADVAAAVDQTWVHVKKPGIVTFVLDTSSSMTGTKLQQARQGVIRALDTMARNNYLGLITFNDSITTRIPVAPLAVNRLKVADVVREARMKGESVLYDAIKAGIAMTDAAPGAAESIRAVVVMTDGRANRGQTRLHHLIHLRSRGEKVVIQDEPIAADVFKVEGGGLIEKEHINGTSLALQTRHLIQVFFIGIGDDADMEVGRLLAEATGADFRGVTEKDLAGVLEAFGRYF